jgi:DNA-binding SARP family transcriptional activator
MLEIRVLGGLSARADGVEVELPPSARARALLAWLAVHPGPHARSVLAGTLRPDVLEESARKSLRQAAWALRGALGPGADAWLVGERERLGLSADPALVRVDLAEFGRLVDEERLDEAVALAGGDLLAGLDEEWVEALRDEHRARIVAVLGALADRAEAAGDGPGAVEWSRRRVAADPLGERSARDLIARLARAGDRAGALAAYEGLRERLRRDLGIVPAAETRELVEELRRGRPSRPPAGAGPAAQPPMPPPLAGGGAFVGRAATLARLESAWRDAAAGALRIACLAGEPGIGKTRAAAELAARVHAAGGTVLYGRSDEETLVPHQPFVEALERLLRAASAEEREALIGPHRGDLARLLPALDRGDEPAAPGEGATARYRAFEAVRALVEAAAARRPALLVLDDLHWADPATLLLLRHLGRALERAPVLVLVAYRDTEVDRGHPLALTLADLRREHPLVAIELEGLSGAEVADLLGGDREVAEALRARTSGNPLFLAEVRRHLSEGGSGEGLPPGVKEVIGRRLDRLGDGAVEVLTTAALAGGEVDLPLLEDLHGADEALAAVERADAAGLLLARGTGGRPAFAHALVAETLQDGASAARRARVHARIAGALEERPGARAADVARHLVAAGDAGDAERTVRWSLAAAEEAAGLSADADAAVHLERALAALPAGDPRRGEVGARLGDALSRAGARAAARAAFLGAAAEGRRAGDPDLLGRAALGAGGLGVTIGPCDEELAALLEEAIAAVGPGGGALRARLLGRLATELYYEDRDRADALSREAVDAARGCGDAAALATALNARRVAIWDIHHAPERLETATEMVAEAERAGDPELVLQGRNWRVLDLMELGRVDDARAEVDAYEGVADALGLPHYRWWVPLWRATLALIAGRGEEAEALGREALALGHRAEDPNAELFVGIQRAWGALDPDAFTEADRAYVARSMAASPAPWAWMTGLAWIDAVLGREGEARELVDRLTRDDLAALPLDANWHAALDLCEALDVLGDGPRAERLYAHLAPFARLHAVVARAVYWYGPVDHYLGLLALTAGDPARAEGHLVAALAEAERVGAGPRAAATRALLDRARSATAG